MCPKKGITGEDESVTLETRPVTIVIPSFGGVALCVERLQTDQLVVVDGGARRSLNEMVVMASRCRNNDGALGDSGDDHPEDDGALEPLCFSALSVSDDDDDRRRRRRPRPRPRRRRLLHQLRVLRRVSDAE